ncbi:hypothetical protein [Streptomyces alboflavus]|uniref:hypothetical protein n=1 Tax=Streptomyces alboflavus TaxID=67267 RepID=UPI000526B149|nr:hypothetical protein [Streptomyces alboflavus]
MESNQNAQHTQHTQRTQPTQAAERTASGATDGTESAARRASFGQLPAHIRYEDMVEERTATPHHPSRYSYDPEGSWRSFACVAADLGL